MAQQGGRIDFQIGFKTDKSGIQDLKKSLQQIQKIKPANFDGTNQDLQEVKSTAKEVEAALSKAFNPNINSINLKTFDNQLKASGKTINDIYTSFSKAGAQGQVAFSQMARSVLTTNQQLKETHSIINQMGTTFVNTIKWGVASSIMNTFTASVQGAFTYVESLEKSLTNIRIVTGDSQEKMEQFADSANRAAQELGRSTMDYSKAALTFYQQGLGEEDVQARTEAVLKAQNITGAGSQMADYLTAVWNGYKVANEQAQVYVDKLAAVADRSASDMSQLAIGMSKVASTANTMGVNVDQLNAQLATVIATTRQAPEAVGTAFKTIYTRLNDIKTGADGAQVSLGNYSGKMAALGFNVLDATGHLRDTGQVMQEIGARWEDLTREQQVYLATTMGGQRQVNQLMALFDNWTTYSELLNTSLESEGTLAQKNSVYLESLGAKMEQLGAAGERVKASLIDNESFGNVIELLTTGTNLLGSFIQAIGGGGTALLGLGGIATQVFSGVISKEINNAIVNFQNMKFNAQQTAKELQLTQQFGERNNFDQSKVIDQMLKAKQQMQGYYSVMSTEQRNAYNELVNALGVAKEQVITEEDKIKKAEQYNKALQAVADEYQIDLQAQRLGVVEYTDSITNLLNNLKKGSGDKSTLFADLNLQIEELETNLGTMSPKLKSMFEQLKSLQGEKEDKDRILAAFFPNGDKGLQQQSQALRRKITNLINQINNEVKNLTDLSIDIDVHTKGLKEAKEDLAKAEEAVKNYQKTMSQALDVKNIVSGIGEIGRMSSAFMALGNSIKTAFDSNISPSEKFFKILMSASYSIPTIVTSFERLKTYTKSLSDAIKAANIVKQAQNKIDTAKAAIQEKEIANNAIESGQRIAEATEEGIVTTAKGAETVATNLLAAAQERLAAARATNPLGLTLLVIAGAVLAIKGLTAAYDAVTMSTEQAGQAIDKFNQKAEQTKNTIKQYNTNISNLDAAKEEWEELADRAGSYNTTIDNLTEDEKARYFELSNLIAQYNEGAVQGYDEQGNAIIANNDALKETIQLLKQKRQEEINDTYSGEDFQQAQKGRQAYAKDANKQGKKFTNIAEGSANEILDYLNSYGNDLDDGLTGFRDRLAEITAKGEKGILEHQEELIQIFEKLMESGKLPDAYMSQPILDTLKDYSDKYTDDIKGALDGFNEDVIGVLQVSTDNEGSNFTKAEQAGLTNMRGIVSSYIEGMDKYNPDGTLKTPQEIAKQVQKEIVTPIYESLGQIDPQTEESLYQKLIKSITEDDKLQNNDFSSLEEKNNYIVQKIEDFIQSNIEAFENLTPDAKKALEDLFANLYNLDSLKINFKTGKVEQSVDKALDRLAKRINKDWDELDAKTQDKKRNALTSILKSDIDEKELDYITQHIEKAIKIYGNEVEAIKALQEQASKLGNLDDNLNTMSLLDKQASGEKLGQKEQQSLQSGLNTLKDSYPDLIKQVQILQTQWMQGTSAYEQALRKVKMALIDTLGESLNKALLQAEDSVLQQEKALQDYNNKILDLTRTTEDYQTILRLSKVTDQTKQQSLIKIATSYESCRDQLEKYYKTIQEHPDDLQAQEPERFALERSTRAAENGEQFGIDPERIQTLAAQYSELADQEAAGYEGLNQNAELAADAATRYIRLNDAIADLQQNYDKVTSVLSDLRTLGLEEIAANKDLSDTFQQIKKDVAGIVDTSEDLIGDDWIKDHAGQIQAALEGDQQAIDSLREAAQEEILTNVGIDFEGFDEQKAGFLSRLNELEDGADITAEMSLDDVAFLQNLVSAMQQAGMAQADIENALSGLGIDVDLAPYEEGLNSAIDQAAEAGMLSSDAFAGNAGVNSTITTSTDTAQDTVQAPGYDVTPTDVPFSISLPVVAPAMYPGVAIPTFTGGIATAPGSYPSIEVTPKTESVEATKETTGTGLQVVGARKSSGGKVSHKNASGGNKKSSGGKGKGGKGKKGGGKKGSTKTPKVQKPITDKPDRYHDVNLKLKDIDNDLGKLQKKQQKLTGKDLLKNLNEQLKLLEKQVATYKEKIQLEKQQADQIRNRLKKQGATFGPDGNISNYNKVLSDALNEYNATIAKYNKMSAEEQQKNKDMLEKAKQKYENLKKDIQRYDKIISEEIPGLEKAVQEAIDKQTQINIQKFKVKVDLEMDMSEAQREFNQFVKKVKKQLRDDDVLGNAQAYLKDYSSYYKGGYDVIQALTDQIRNTRNQINNIDKQGSSSVYGKDRAAAIKDLQEYTKELMSNLSDIEDVVANIKNTIFDAIDKAQDAFDEQKKEYEYIADLIEHNQKVVQLLYGEDAYNQLQEYYKLQQKNNNNQLDFLRRQKEMWYSRMEAERKRMNNLTEGTNAWKEANDRFEEYKRHWMDSLDEINGQIQNSIENLIDKYTNAVDKIFLAFENNITGGKGLENISEEWQLIGKQADQYLDKVNSMYEIDKLENAYRDAIDDNDGNLKAQQSLNNLMNEQLKYLKDKDKLTQYDVDRANALLQIEIKRLALEQARQSKTKLRLRRDSQGNYTYQYTADEDATRQAQQELADAENSLYNLTKQSYKNNLDDYYDTTEEMNEKIRDVYKDTTLSAEEQNQKIAMIYEYYGDIINGLTQQNEDLKRFMMEDTFNEMAKMYDTNVQNFKNMTDEEKDIFMNDMVPYWKSSIQDMADTFAGAGGFGPITQDLFKDLIDNSKDYQDSLDEIGKVANVSLEQIKNATDINIQRAESLLEKNDELINSYNKEMTKVQEVINQVNALTNAYQKAKNEAIAATQAAYNFNQQDNAKTVSSLINNKKTAGDAQYRKAASFDTGGYTGDWGDMGKAAILHEKEIVLNSYDTTNLLSAVKITRTLDNIISNFAMKPFTLGNVINNANSSTEGMEQNITIHADFPNVTEKSQIEAAFNNLVNKASQYAFRNKR